MDWKLLTEAGVEVTDWLRMAMTQDCGGGFDAGAGGEDDEDGG